MEELLKDNTLIITKDKNKLIKDISLTNKMSSIKIITMNELISGFYFDYDEKAIYYLMNKYNIKADIANIYIKNMYFIDNNYTNNKLNKIYELKKELIENNLLIINKFFKDFLKTKNISLYGIDYIPNIVKKILNNFDYKIINKKDENYKHTIYEFNTLDEEVAFIATKIVSLIKSGIDINKIYLSNLNDEYRLIIKRIFKMFNIPVYLKESYSIYNTHTSNLFMSLYDSNINSTLKSLEEKINKDEIEIYNKIVKICNKYIWCDDYLKVKDLIISDLKNTSVNLPIIQNSVKEISNYSSIEDDEYLFLVSFNQGVIPVINKDEDYLSDKDKEILGLETSIDKNLIEKQKVINILSRIKNVFITYKLKSLTDTFSISNINEELKYEVVKEEINYNFSNMYNKIILSSNLDTFNKYGTITTTLNKLYSNYPSIEYRLYNNKFTGIDKNNLYKYLDNKLLLSYSSLDNYNRCNFRFYLNNILKLNVFEESFMQYIGNLFHYILSKAFTNDFNYDEEFDSYIKQKEHSKKELFFIKKLKEELKFIIETINNHNRHTSLNEELYEEKIYVNIEGNIKITFMGIIDKLKYKKVNDKYIVAIIDYKTGNPNLNLNNVKYGIEMQLPIYIFLTHNHSKFEGNIEVAGFYLQKILNNEITADGKNSYLDLKKKNLLLQGYSNDNTNILEYFDDSYADSSVVKSLKMTSKGFYSYSKVIDNNTINRLVKITEDKIKQSSNDILDAKFDINPKRIGYENLGCEFCNFKDICFRTEKDIVNLKEYKDLEFLKGDEDGVD